MLILQLFMKEFEVQVIPVISPAKLANEYTSFGQVQIPSYLVKHYYLYTLHTLDRKHVSFTNQNYMSKFPLQIPLYSAIV